LTTPGPQPTLRTAGALGEGDPRTGTPDAPGRPVAGIADRWWFLIVWVAALAVFMAVDRGQMTADTKLGVDINASEFYARLWPLWNPLEGFGTLQDQYIGYAIPMAPFFLAGQLMHIPVWIIERLWLSLLVAAGFAGMVKLARALRVGTPASRLLAGALFALWPAFTILIGTTSAGILPGLLLPWAVLPLVPVVPRGGPGGRFPPEEEGHSGVARAVARSGLAIALMGGVNAASTLYVLILPALYILVGARGRRRVTLAFSWVVAVLAATAWWLVPLLLQGRYSFNFLPYIEQASVTGRTMSAAAVLRGTGAWTAYFNLGGFSLRSGWVMVTSSAAILAAAGAAAAGLYGLARRDMPERPWLVSSVALAALIMLSGYYGPLSGPFHGPVDQLFDGALAPLRSAYKLEPVIGAALALGCAHALARLWRLARPAGGAALVAVAVPAALALAGLALPQLTGQVLQGSFTRIPSYWDQAAGYLSAHAPRLTAMVVPADPHGQFLWGYTNDDPMEPLASSPWVTRAIQPYAAGSQQLLETIESAVDSGQQVPGLAAYLDRAGIRYVVVRNDMSPSMTDYTPPQDANETMALSGFERVAAFGPMIAAVPAYPADAGTVPGYAPSYPAVEVFQAVSPVQRPSSPVSALPLSRTTLVNGGPGSLLQLDAQGLLSASSPAVISGDKLAGPPAVWTVTDGQQRADNEFGLTQDYTSFTYTAAERNPPDDPLGGAGGPPRQLLAVPAAGHQTVAVLSGAASVTASSYGSTFSESPQYNPVNAFDGNPSTAWAEGDPDTPVGQWIQIDFTHPVDLPSTVGVELLDDAPYRSLARQLDVSTAAGSVSTGMTATGSRQSLGVPPGLTSWLRITITAASNVTAGFSGAGITDVLIPGITVTSYLQPAEDPAGKEAPAVVYSFEQQAQPGYAQATAYAGLKLARTFRTPAAEQLTFSATAVPNRGPGLDSLIDSLTPVTQSTFKATASSTYDWLPALGADNLFTSGVDTPWVAAADDLSPTIHLRWRAERTIGMLILTGARGQAGVPASVQVSSQAGTRLLPVGAGGVVTLRPPVRTDELGLTFPMLASDATGDTAKGQPSLLPVGLAKVTIPALHGLRLAEPAPSTPFHLACGQGPGIAIDGVYYQTSVSGTLGDLTGLRQVHLGLCTAGGTVSLRAGQNQLLAGQSVSFTITGLSLTGATSAAQAATAASGTPRPLQVLSWQDDSRSLRIGPGTSSYVEIHENYDSGWTATLDGKRLTAAILDGWQQAFVVPAGQGGVIRLSFAPATLYHVGIAVSALALLALLVIAIGTGWLRLMSRFLFRRRRELPEAVLPEAVLPEAVLPEAAGPVASAERGRPLGQLVTLVLVTALIVVAGGFAAVAVPVLAIIGRKRPAWLPRIAAAAMLAAGMVSAIASQRTVLGSGVFGGPAQACALIALAAALMPVLLPAPRAVLALPPRREGRSGEPMSPA
jgi:arabinofuranan 3-O-arabinosyltransferase